MRVFLYWIWAVSQEMSNGVKKFIPIFHLIINASGSVYRIFEARFEQLVVCRVSGGGVRG